MRKFAIIVLCICLLLSYLCAQDGVIIKNEHDLNIINNTIQQNAGSIQLPSNIPETLKLKQQIPVQPSVQTATNQLQHKVETTNSRKISQENNPGRPVQVLSNVANAAPGVMRPMPPQAPLQTPQNPPSLQNVPTLPNPLSNRVTVSNIRGNISLNFDDADIYSVLQTVFGEILKVNYIIDPKVKGRVTFRSVAPVAQDKVLPIMEVILRLNGVAIVDESDLYRIIPISDLSREPAAIRLGRNSDEVSLKGKALLQVVPINHLQSSEIVKLLMPFVSASAVIVDVSKTNHIIVVDTDANVKRLLQLVNIFDSEQQKKKGPQVFVHHVQNGKARDITALLQQIFLSGKQITTAIGNIQQAMPMTPPRPHAVGAGSSGGTEVLVSDIVKIFADEILNVIIITGTLEDYQVIKETINKLDIVPRQVLIEGSIASVQLTDKMSLGLAWSIKTNLFNLNPVTISMNPSSLNIDTTKANPGSSGLNLIGIDAAGSVRAVINALASQSKAKLLASPHIMVSDNREARIQVGQQVPIPTSETYGTTVGTTTVPIRTIQYKDIGVILKVKPQINDSGLVALQISQEVSTYSTILLYSDEKQIILNKTEATTNLVVQDGQTIVIGGLIREDDSKARSGIPFLSKIPILGYLFGNSDDDASRTELVILLTPHVVKNQKDAASITEKIVGKVTDDKMNESSKKILK